MFKMKTKKIIYLNGNRFKYSTLEKLQKEALKYNLIIGNNCEIGNNCKIGNYCKIGNSCKIGNNCKIGNSCKIENNCEIGNNYKIGNYCKIMKNTKLSKQIVLYNFYGYVASGYIDLNTNKKVIQLGCFIKFEEDYKFKTKEFYTEEFKKGTDETKKREEAFKIISGALK